MKASTYDAWHQSEQGAWVGQQEYSALQQLFSPQRGQTLLDVGSAVQVILVAVLLKQV